MRSWILAVTLLGIADPNAAPSPPTSDTPPASPDAPATPDASQAAPDASEDAPVIIDTNIDPALMDDAWSRATNGRGARGGLTLDAAHALQPHAFVLQVRTELAYATDLFEAGDNDLYNVEQFSAVWSPVRHFEIGLSGSLQVNRWRRFVDAGITVFGDTTLRAKYTVTPSARWGVGGLVSWLVPASLGDASLAFPASTLNLTGLVSYAPISRLELTANVGLVWDHSDKLAATPDPDKRFVYQVNQGSGLTLGVGGQREFAPLPTWALTPFVEVGGLVKHLSGWHGNPWLATVGLKSYMLPSSLFEFMLGVKLRLSGAPEVGGDYPGLLPWMGFFGITVHVLDAPPPAVSGTPCTNGNDCPEGQQCIANRCHYVTEVIKQVTRTVKEKTFLVAGTVLDIDTHQPVDGAEVTFTGFEHTPVAINQKTGAYTSFPLKCGEGLLEMQVKAPSYKPFVYPLARGDANQTIKVEVKLRKAERPDVGRIEGSIKDNRTGGPVQRAKLVIISLGITVPTGDNGQFSRDVPVGRHDVLISAPGYITQRKKIVVHDADVVIFNVDLAPSRRKHGPARAPAPE